ncbi:protein kinase [Thermodesulfobacteriota bacterium]
MEGTPAEKRAVLTIDSDPIKRERSNRLLSEKGYHVYTAGTLEEALALVDEKRILTALLALGRPGLDPGRLIQHLKKGNARIPVIVILDHFEEDLVASALKAGAVDYLVRPVDDEEMIRRVGVHARIKEDSKAISESLSRYEKHFGVSEKGLFYTRKDGELLECNETLVKMLGYDRKEELLHRNVEETIYRYPEERSRFRKTLEEKGTVKDFRVTFRKKGGDPLTILISGQVVRDDDGDIIGYRGENIAVEEPQPSSTPQGILAGLLPRFSGGFHSLFSATEILGERYEKMVRLGIGSFGEVWKVRDIIKDPPATFVAKIPISKKLNAKVEKEVRILRRLAGHINVPGVFEIVEVKRKKVLIQEFIQGKTLREVIERELAEREVASVMIQLIDVTAHAHRMGIMHRDIKPGNIMVRPDGILKLLDFGAAKELKEQEMSDTVTGSRPYMSPEQIMGKSQRRSDVWALGVVMYLLYTGMFPFYHDVEKVLMDMILELPVPPPEKYNVDIHPEMESIIMKCLEKDLESRYPDAGALKSDIMVRIPGYGERIVPLY